MGAFRLSFLAGPLIAASICAGGVALAQAPASPQAAAQAPPPATARVVTRTGEDPVLDGAASDMAFVSGERPRISANVADDILAAGRDLKVEGASADHLIIAGGEIDLAPATLHDLLAAGGQIRFRNGAVSDDVVIAGGEVEIDRNVRIDGSAVLTGGRLRIDARVGGELRAAGGRVELNGSVAGDVRIRADEIVIGPQARIGGNLYVRGAEIEISPSAVVQGRTLREEVKRERRAAPGFAVLGVLFALGILLMHGLIAAVAPGIVGVVDRGLHSTLWSTLGVGALIVMLTPVVIALLGATVLGAPLAVALALAYLLAIPLAFAGVSYWIGQLIRARVSTRGGEPPRWPARFGWTVLGALLVVIACMIPFVGWLVWLVAFAAGVGGLARLAFWRQPTPATAAAG